MKRKEVQKTNAVYTDKANNDDEKARRLEARLIQAEKNKRKMERVRKISTSPTKNMNKYRR